MLRARVNFDAVADEVDQPDFGDPRAGVGRQLDLTVILNAGMATSMAINTSAG
jgi:hypothetical protein